MASPLQEFLSQLGYALLQRNEDGTFLLLSEVPDWFAQLWPAAKSTDSIISFRDRSPFLEGFLLDAEDILEILANRILRIRHLDRKDFQRPGDRPGSQGVAPARENTCWPFTPRKNSTRRKCRFCKPLGTLFLSMKNCSVKFRRKKFCCTASFTIYRNRSARCAVHSIAWPWKRTQKRREIH